MKAAKSVIATIGLVKRVLRQNVVAAMLSPPKSKYVPTFRTYGTCRAQVLLICQIQVTLLLWAA